MKLSALLPAYERARWEIYEGSVIRAAIRDMIPALCTHPWVTKDLGVWREPPGPLSGYLGDLRKLVYPLRDKQGRFFEQQFESWYAQCVRFGDAVAAKWKGIDFHQNRKLPPFDWDKFLDLCLPSPSPRRLALERVRPKDTQASNGLTVLQGPREHIVLGQKGGVWWVLLAAARRLAERAQELYDQGRLRWDTPIPELKRVLRELAMVYVAFWRTDSKPIKPRLIWGSCSLGYILDSILGYALGLDLKRTEWYGYKPEKAALRFVALGHGPWVSLDFKSFDLHIQFERQRGLWKALAGRYGWSEPVAILMCAYNTLADIEGPYGLQEREGIQASGSGIFAFLNSLLSLSEVWDAFLDRAYAPAEVGLVFGDNVVCRLPRDGVEAGIARVLERHGGVIDPKECSIGSSAVFLRRILSPTGAMVPVIMSRARNCLCPKEPLIEKEWRSGRIVDEIARARVAMSLRAASAEVKLACDVGEAKANNVALWSYWSQNIAPREYLWLEKSDAELQGIWNQGSSSNGLTWVKRLRGIEDTRTLLE